MATIVLAAIFMALPMQTHRIPRGEQPTDIRPVCPEPPPQTIPIPPMEK